MTEHRFDVASLLTESEAILRGGLELTPLPVEPGLARAEGVFRSSPAVIETRVYAGPVIRFARFAYISGAGLEIANVLCLSHAHTPLPIFGADLVSISADSAMIAADLSPVLPADAASPVLAPIARRRASPVDLPPGGELPAWCSTWFSPFALFTRITQAERPRAAAAYLDFPRAFVEIARAEPRSPGRAREVDEAQSRYLADHRTQDKGLGMLAKMFGPDWSARYIEQVLFPAASPLAFNLI